VIRKALKRRTYLGTVAAGALVGLAGCNSSESDDEETTTENTVDGRDDEKADPSENDDRRPDDGEDVTRNTDVPTHDHSGRETGGSSLSPADVTTSRLLNDIGDAGIQTSFDGLVVPIAPGLGMDAAVDPRDTNTPIQDAIDTIDGDDPAQAGAVLLPPGQIEEAGPLVRTKFKQFLGWGTFGTVVKFTDYSEPGIAQDPDVHRDASQSYWDGIRFIGGGADLSPGDRTAPWLHLEPHEPTPNTIGGFNVGRLRLDYWGDPVIHFDENHLFESHWEWVEMKDHIYGRAILDERSMGGSGWTCGKLNLRRAGAGRIIDARESGGGHFTVQSLHVMHEPAPGSQAVPAIDLQIISGLADVHFNQLHYEANTVDGEEPHRMPSLVRVSGGTGKIRIDSLSTLGGSFDYVLELEDSMHLARIGRIEWSGSELREYPIRIAGFLPEGWHQRGNIVYEGPSLHVEDDTDSRLGHIYALGDQKVVDPLYRGTVTHEPGATTRVEGISTRGREGSIGGRETGKITPRIQTLEPVELPEAPFRIDHGFEWHPDRGADGGWDLILDWETDPGIGVEFEVEVVARSADGHGIDLRGQEWEPS